MIEANNPMKIFLQLQGKSTIKTIEILLLYNLLNKFQICKTCGSEMVLRKKNSIADKICWACPKKDCLKNKSTISIRTGSFFANFKSSLSDIFSIILLWSCEKQMKDIIKDYGLSKGVVVDVFT